MSSFRRIRPLAALLVLLGTTGVVACNDGVGQSSDFVRDSWQNPTAHGELQFDAHKPR